jgi:hypothetical protein
MVLKNIIGTRLILARQAFVVRLVTQHWHHSKFDSHFRLNLEETKPMKNASNNPFQRTGSQLRCLPAAGLRRWTDAS